MPNIKITFKTAKGTQGVIEVDNQRSLADYQTDIQGLIKELAQQEDKKGETNHFDLMHAGSPIDHTKTLTEQGFNKDILLMISPLPSPSAKVLPTEALDSKLEALKETAKENLDPTLEVYKETAKESLDSTLEVHKETAEEILDFKLEKPNETSQNLLENSGLKYLFAIRPDNLFKLVVDGRFHAQQKGFMGYEKREPGSVQKVLDAIAMGGAFFISRQEKLSTELIRKVHYTCTLVESLRSQGTLGGEFREAGSLFNNPLAFGLGWLSVDGVKDLEEFRNLLLSKTENRAYSYVSFDFRCHNFSLLNFKNQNIKAGEIAFLHGVIHSKQDCQIFFDHIAATYNEREKKAKDDNEMIEAMIDAAYSIEHLHGFNDANMRTTLVCLNILLMSKGFPPVTYYDPNMIDGISKKEFFSIVREGMLKTLDIIKNPDKGQFGFDHSHLGKTEKAVIQTMTLNVMQLKKHLGLKEVEIDDISKIEKRINALTEYSTKPTFIYENDKAVNDVAKVLEKACQNEKKDEDAMVRKLLQDIRILKKDEKGHNFLSLNETDGDAITRAIFEDEEKAMDFAAICEEHKATSEKTGNEKLYVKHGQNTFAIYLSPKDVAILQKKLAKQQTGPDLPFDHLAYRYSFYIEMVQKTYAFTFRDQTVAAAFLDEFPCVKMSASLPGMRKRIRKEPLSLVGSMFFDPKALVLFSKEDLRKLNKAVSDKLEEKQKLLGQSKS